MSKEFGGNVTSTLGGWAWAPLPNPTLRQRSLPPLRRQYGNITYSNSLLDTLGSFRSSMD